MRSAVARAAIICLGLLASVMVAIGLVVVVVVVVLLLFHDGDGSLERMRTRELSP